MIQSHHGFDACSPTVHPLFAHLPKPQQQVICSTIPQLQKNNDFIDLCTKINALNPHTTNSTHSGTADSKILNAELKGTLSWIKKQPALQEEMTHLIDLFKEKINDVSLLEPDRLEFKNLAESFTLVQKESFSEEILKKAAESLKILLERARPARGKSLAPATKAALKHFGKDKLEKIINKHVRFYDNWECYSVKKPGLTQLYSENQQIYGCLFAAFSHALAEEIKDRQPILDRLIATRTTEIEKETNPTPELGGKGSIEDFLDFCADSVDEQDSDAASFCLSECDDRRPSQEESDDQALRELMGNLQALACFGRQLIAQVQGLPPSHVERYGTPRDREAWTPLVGPYAHLAEQLTKKLTEDLPHQCLELHESGDLTYLGKSVGERPLPLTTFSPSSSNIIHTGPRLISSWEYTNFLEESLFMQGGELHQTLGSFFWWWCHVKPVELGDPSIGEMLFKAVLISKGLEVPGWKGGVVPWEETLLHYDCGEFAKTFSSLWEPVKIPLFSHCSQEQQERIEGLLTPELSRDAHYLTLCSVMAGLQDAEYSQEYEKIEAQLTAALLANEDYGGMLSQMEGLIAYCEAQACGIHDSDPISKTTKLLLHCLKIAHHQRPADSG